MKFYTTSKLSENISETPEGYLVCLGVSIARTGEMIYAKSELPELEADSNGKIVVSRDVKEVLRDETIASFEGKPVTIGHPNDFASPENWRELTKGIIQNVRKGEGEQNNDIVADLLITDKEAIALVKNGLREVSCGYDAVYVQTGVGTATQSEIIGNHLALVDQGRAGASYAIKDHKGKGSRMKISEKIKAIFARAQDEAMKVAEEDAAVVPAKEEPKAASYDDLMKAVKDLGEKVAGLAPKKADDASTPPTQKEPAEVEAKDDEVAPSLEERLKKLEDLVATLAAREAKEDEVPVGDEGEEVEDADEEEVESDDDAAACDADEEEEPKKTGDDASRIEILAPGMKADGKNIRAKALAAAYETDEGKEVIKKFTGDKAPDFKNAATVDSLFVAVSEVLKVQRAAKFAKTKTSDSNAGTPKSGVVTPEKLNEMNAKRYAVK